MATWRKTEGPGMNPKVSATPPKKTPKSYETHPGSPGKGKVGLGSKNPDGRAKM